MSLSNYYKNSKSFQPEELVKQDSGKSRGWTPAARRDDYSPATSRFTAAKSPAPDSASRISAAPPLPVIGDTASSIAENGGVSGDSQTPGEIVQDERELDEGRIDLSNYIERVEAENQIAEAYRQGFEQGHREGHDKAELDFGAAARALLLACQQLDTLRETIIGNSSREILDFTLAIAERIVRISVREQDASIVATIEEALRRAVKSDEFSIFIHPDDYAAVSAKTTEIVAGISGLNNIVLRMDKTIERGGAKIESDNCTIDATLAGQFESIREEIKKKL